MLEFEKLNSDIVEYETDLKMAKTNFQKFDKDYKKIIHKKSMIDSTTEKLKNYIEEKVRKHILFKLLVFSYRRFLRGIEVFILDKKKQIQMMSLLIFIFYF